MTVIFGAILGGGAGARMGGRKAMAMLAGKPLAAHVAAVLRPHVAELAVVGDAEAAQALDATHVADLPELARGPLVGVASGLTWAVARGAEWLVVAPCDTPLLPPDFPARLLAGAAGRNAAYAETSEGPHPLASLWRCSLALRLCEVLKQDHPPVRRALEAFSAAVVQFEEAEAFMNVNTPNDLRLTDARLAAPKH